MSKGGNGAHWEGCEDVHDECFLLAEMRCIRDVADINADCCLGCDTVRGNAQETLDKMASRAAAIGGTA